VGPDLIVVGDVMVDVAVEAGALKRGGDVHGEVRLRFGGAGANAAVWAAHAGAAVRLHGRVGDDPFGRAACEALRERGVDVALAVDPEERTGSMLVVRDGADRSMVADRGANGRLAPGDLPEALDAQAVLLSGYLLFGPGSRAAARAALERATARWLAVDAASWPLIEAFGALPFFEATSRATLLLANELEARVLQPVLGRYPATCVKLGPRGAELATSEGVVRAQGSERSDGDPTGAGDAFDGVLLAGLARGHDPAQALRRACDAGSRAAGSFEVWP
jgi:sugar/nucleoside kinase (ribokinase family)